MYSLLTKENRLKSQEIQFSTLIASGYNKEDYKGLKFFTKEDGKFFTLKVFKDAASNHIEYMNYRSLERRAEVINSYKNNYDSRLKYKEDQKIKNKGKLSSHAAASAAIKAELKELYPHINFSCKSSSFSMGDSVHINWTDGPTSEEVNNIISKYQYGHFNGMEDIYENTNNRNDIPQSKYISGSRSMSDELEDILLPDAERLFNADHYNYIHTAKDFLRQIFYHTSIPDGANPTGIISNGTTCGISRPETFYTLTFDINEVKETEQPAQKIEVPKNRIQVIDYSEKAIAVIGDFSMFYDALILAGGRYNSRLKCGKGIIFSKKRIEEVKDILSKSKKDVPNEIKQLPAPQPTTLKDEIKETIQFFKETDLKIYGEVSENTKQAAKMQGVELYDNLEDINTAAQSGKVISLCNLNSLLKRK